MVRKELIIGAHGREAGAAPVARARGRGAAKLPRRITNRGAKTLNCQGPWGMLVVMFGFADDRVAR